MTQDRSSQLATALGRPADDPLVVRLTSLLNDFAAGRLTDDQAQAELETDPALTPARSQVSFQGASITGNVTLRDVAGRDIINISITLPPSSLATVDERVLRPAPLAYRAAVLRMVEDYQAVFGGRDDQLAALDAFLEQDAKPYALLLAPTGRGKTALLIHWLVHAQANNMWTVIFVPISLRYQTATATATLGALAVSLADFHGERQQLQEYRQTPENLRAIIADYLRRPVPDHKRLLLIIDGLDEAVGWQLSRDLFPRTPGPHLRIVISARQLANTSRADWLDQLGWRAIQTAAFDLSGLDGAAVSDILRRMGNPLDALATDVDLLTEIARISQGDPLTIRLLVEALQDGSLTPGHLIHLPPSLESFIHSWLDELEQHSAQHATVRILLGLCATALGPLTITDLEALAPEQFHVRAKLNQAARAVARFVIGDGSPESGYIFSHPRLRELFLEKVLSEHERAEFRQRFVAYGQAWYDRHLRNITAHSKESIGASRHQSSLSPYLRQFWIAHLAQDNRWSLIRAALTQVVTVADRHEQPWATARSAAEGSYAGYLADLDQLWVYAERCGNLALGLRCALIAASIRSLSGNLAPELLVGLVTVGTPEGKWTVAAALEHVRQMPDSGRQAKAVRMLLDCDCTMALRQILDVAVTITDERSRAEALGSLAPHLPAELLPAALECARTLREEESRIQALGSLAAHLPAAQQPAVYAAALECARTLRKEESRVQALGSLAPHLPAELLSTALEYARAFGDEWRAEALGSLVSRLPTARQPAVYATALKSTRALRDKGRRAQVLANLAPHLPTARQPAVYAAALKSACALQDEWSRVQALGSLAPHLPAAQQPAAYAAALKSARALSDKGSRAEALVSLAPHLPAVQQPAVYAAALDSARELDDEGRQAQILASLAPRLPTAQQPAVYTAALDSARALRDEGRRAQVLASLAPHLPAELLPTALDSARALRDERRRAQVLASLAPRLPTAQQPAVYAVALDSALALRDEESQAKALGSLAPHLSAELLLTALEIARTLHDEWSRARALGSLAPHLPAELLSTALDIACALHDEWSRARALGSLAPHLPAELLLTALECARTLQDEWRRIQALASLAPHLPAAEQLTVYSSALEIACALQDEWRRVQALASLAPHLPTALLSTALECARALRYEERQVQALASLGPHLSAALLPTALDSACALKDEWSRTEALGTLAPHLPAALLPTALDSACALQDERRRAEALSSLAPHLPAELLPTALDSACALQDEGSRAEALSSLAPHLPAELLPTALDSAYALRNEWRRTRALSSLAPHLPAVQQPAVYAAALDSACALRDEGSRAEALASLAPHLPAMQQPAVYSAVLEIACALREEGRRARVLSTLAPHLPAELLSTALESACALQDEWSRAKALGHLAPHLPAELLSTALESARALQDEWSRAEALDTLAPHLPVELLPTALGSARSQQDEWKWAEALGTLAPHLPAELLHTALESACALQDELARARALGILVPHLAAYDFNHTHWRPTLRILAARGRLNLLSDLVVLTPWLAAFATFEDFAEIAIVIRDVSLCWP